MDRKPKVFQMNECDWWIDFTLEEAKKNYIDFLGDDDPIYTDSARELTDDELEQLKYSGADGCEYDPPITFLEEYKNYISLSKHVPYLFATSEY